MKRNILYRCLTIAIVFLSCGDEKKNIITAEETPLLSAPILNVEKIGDGEVRLAWSSVKSDVEGSYRVYRSRGENEALSTLVDITPDTVFVDRGLEYQTEYSYWVAAIDRFGRAGFKSNEVSGQPFNTLAPLAPQNLRVFAHNIPLLEQLDIALDWDSNKEADLRIYRVYRSETELLSISSSLIDSVVDPRYIDLNVEIGKKYYYAVTAVDHGDKESGIGNLASDVPLSLPQHVKPIEGQTAVGPVVFVWHPVPGASFYRVIVTTSPTSGEISDMELVADTTSTFFGRTASRNERLTLESGGIYYWKVVASTHVSGVENSVSSVASFKVR